MVASSITHASSISQSVQLATQGPRPNTEFIATLGSDTLTDRGYVRVKPTLQLASHSDIYAAGDIIDWAEQKQAAKTHAHAAVITANILSNLSGEKPAKEYKGSTELIIITNGKVRPLVCHLSQKPSAQSDFTCC